MQLLYAAAHGGYAEDRAPLGGGAAIFELLTQTWRQAPPPFAVQPLTPRLLLANAPDAATLTGYNESQYAAFCREFSRRTTEQILRHRPEDTLVLANDISEGPDFRLLAERGFPLCTIFHVDVVAYIAEIYARGWLRPHTMVAWYQRLGRWLPRMLQLIFAQQHACVTYSQYCLLPSQQMKQILQQCYPHVPASRFQVMPWGAPPLGGPLPSKAAARAHFALPDSATVLLLLSRLSPEKNQQLLLNALHRWEQQANFPNNLHVLLCGAPAYMHGQRHAERLRHAAARLRRTTVHFAGHVTGPAKLAALAAADLYVFPSCHESYGLTLQEAFLAGLPALTLDHAGARSVMQPAFGEIASPAEFLPALQRLLQHPQRLPELGRAAQAFALANPFAQTARQVADLLLASRHSRNESAPAPAFLSAALPHPGIDT